MSDQNKIVWITGASSGIGLEVALKLAAEGAVVYGSARSEDKLKNLAEQSEKLSGKFVPLPCDVTDYKGVQKAFKTILKEHERLDCVILNAGTYIARHADEFNAEDFGKTFDLNVQGVANCLEPVLEHMLDKRGGHIVLVASVAGFRGLPRSLSYGPSKAALINLAEGLYLECKDKDIKVQVVNPGFVKTPLTDKNDFDMPMLMEADKAAEVFVEGMKTNKFEINFPWQFVYLKKMIDMLPNRAYLWLMRKAIKI